ncbi:helix-turn-helix transcriptional regulator [Devosia sp. SL43]|uniref:helix-turn-helix transcriptional regulator n=1 Tax=Devosia sp. SL43 TaxID=2806348 RepID=UPI001F00AB30|nr:LuxR C-terminal-related transcriptional regulator [Devosia sp. SL43]UJW85880.1 PAS and helix-turn-helix domain-containing protein [Devosia sp. SL43]
MIAALQFALADIPVPMVYATHRIIRDCNAEFAGLFGYRREELVDTSFSRLYPAIADFVRTGDMWRHHLPGGAVYFDERIMAGADGKRFWCRVNGRSRDLSDPFAAALYCFEPMSRPLTQTTLKLTGRQRQILTLVAQGKTSTLIAEEVGLSRRTVEAHRLRLARSVGVANSAELVAWFLSQPSA